jgi:hypothetical protein
VTILKIAAPMVVDVVSSSEGGTGQTVIGTSKKVFRC